MKTAMQMIQDCEALQKLEQLTADNWHDMAEADASLVASRMASVRGLGEPACAELAGAARRLLMYAHWCRAYTLAVMTLAARS